MATFFFGRGEDATEKSALLLLEIYAEHSYIPEISNVDLRRQRRGGPPALYGAEEGLLTVEEEEREEEEEEERMEG